MQVRNLKCALISSIIFIILVGLPFRIILDSYKFNGVIQSLTCNIHGKDMNTYISLGHIADGYSASIIHTENHITTKLYYKINEYEILRLVNSLDNLELDTRKQSLTVKNNATYLITRGKCTGDLSLTLSNKEDNNIIKDLVRAIIDTTKGKGIIVKKQFNPDVFTTLMIIQKQEENSNIDTNNKNNTYGGDNLNIIEDIKEVFN